MPTPRSALTRRLIAALDTWPSRIPVLLGGTGSGRTTLLQLIRDRAGRTAAQYLDVERTATTPERFYRAVTGASPFPAANVTPATARTAFDAALKFFTEARAGGGFLRRSCSTNSWNSAPSRVSPASAGSSTSSSTLWRQATTISCSRVATPLELSGGSVTSRHASRSCICPR